MQALHSDSLPSPLHPLMATGKQLGIELWIKRDDCIAFPASGNKVRKATRRLEALETHIRGIVSVGGTGSNHLRTLAMLAARAGLRCHFVVHSSHKFHHPNLKLMRLAGAEITFCEPDKIRQAVDSLIGQLGSGWQVLEGGGHDVWGLNSYADAADELRTQSLGSGSGEFDYIVLASGTGTTQAGIIVGTEGWSTVPEIIGISVARDRKRGTEAVINALAWVDGNARRVVFDDRFRGTYGEPTQGGEEAIRRIMVNEGIPLDPTYTAKAFHGLEELVSAGRIRKSARVLFWHTGGLLNLAGEWDSKDVE